MPEETLERRSSVAAPLVFAVVMAFHVLSWWFDRLKKVRVASFGVRGSSATNLSSLDSNPSETMEELSRNAVIKRGSMRFDQRGFLFFLGRIGGWDGDPAAQGD